MSDLAERLESISPERRALLQLLLKERRKGLQVPIGPRRLGRASLPLSYGQERLWFIDQLEPKSALYNMSEGIRIKGELNVEGLRQALREVVRRHEILRTVFVSKEGRGYQEVREGIEVGVREVDLSRLCEEEGERKLREVMGEEAREWFDLEEGPLMRVVLIKRREDEHVLEIVMHHIVSDGWSIGVMIREIGGIYESWDRGERSGLEEMKLQYGDYAVWQREEERGEELEEEMRYWREQLEGAPRMIEMPTDYRRPTEQSYRGGREEIRVGREVVEGLKELGREEGASLYMVLLAGFEMVMSRAAGQSELVIGTRVAGRSRREIEGLIGFLVNVVVMKDMVEEERSIREQVRVVRETALRGFGHQEVPIEYVVKELRPERGISQTPLFNVMFVLHNLPMPVLAVGGVKIEGLETDSGTAKYDLDVTIWESNEGGLRGWVEYSRDLYEGTTIRRLIEHYKRVLGRMVEDAGDKIKRVEMLSEAERHQVMYEFNDTRKEYREEMPQELLERQSERRRDAIAVSHGEEQITYGELNGLGNQLGEYLRRKGVGPEVGVGVMLERSISTVIGLVGIIKAGGVYVPLDAGYPQSHIEEIVEGSGIEVVISDRRHEERAVAARSKLILIDEEWEEIGVMSRRNPEVTVVGENLMYVFYTSGSTGKAKGVAIEQRQFINRVKWMWERYPFEGGEVMCQRTTANFSVSMWELLGGVLGGVRTVIAGGEKARDVEGLIEEIWEKEVTRIVVVPSLLKAILGSGEGARKKLVNVRQWSVCGEMLEGSVYERFREEYGERVRLINQWGSTETNDISHNETGRNGRGEWRGRLSIGVGEPISNTAIYIVEKEGRIAGIGQRGEAYVKQKGEARGYVGRGDETAQKAVPDWISGAAGGRLVSMGDVIRREGTGGIEWEGRRDKQVKIRGMRVEVKGVEAELRKHKTVKEAAVVVREGVGGNELVAYVDLRQGETTSAEEVRRWMKERIAEWSVPAEVVVIDAIPMTPNGKIDRQRLTAMERVSSSYDLSFIAPTTDFEQTIASIWQELLGIEKIGVDANFFDLGGHSLLLVAVRNKLRDALRRDLSLVDVYRNPTIRSQARLLSAAAPELGSVQGAINRASRRRKAHRVRTKEQVE